MNFRDCKLWKFLKESFVFASICCLYGCTSPIVKLPNHNSSPEPIERFSAPRDVVASHGQDKSITLSWTGTSYDHHYVIYEADTPFADNLSVVKITDSATPTVTLSNLNDGVIKYYYVEAVMGGSKPERPKRSLYPVCGSTLDIPYICEITCEEKDSSSNTTISWSMANCTKDTYLSKVNYEVHVYDEAGNEIPELLKTTSKSVNSVVYTTLNPNTSYYFSVSSYIDGNDSAKKTTTPINCTTAALRTPLKPKDIDSLKGVDEGKNVIFWTLPNKTSYEEDNLLKNKALYFTVERKIIDASDSDYEVIADYVGTSQDNAKEFAKAILIDCSLEADIDSIDETLSYGAVVTEKGAAVDSSDLIYIPGSRIAFIDRNVEIGKQYTYRVRSFVDVAEKRITGTNSFDTVNAWTLSPASLKVNSEYVLTEDLKDIAQIDFLFNMSFNDFGLSNNYTYLVSYEKENFDGSKDAEKELFVAQSFNELQNHFNESIIVKNPKYVSNDSSLQDEGYYTFYLYVLKKDFSGNLPVSEDVLYKKAASLGKTTIAWDAKVIPNLSSFDIKDGYSDHFEILFNIFSDNSYNLKWVDEDGSTSYIDISSIFEKMQTEGVSTYSDPEFLYTVTLNSSSNEVIISHVAKENSSRDYVLEAVNRTSKVTASKEFKTVYTLGIPSVLKSEKMYDSISVNWKNVNCCDAYHAVAYYKEDGESKPFFDTQISIADNSSEYSLTKSGDIFKLDILHPEGFDNYTKSGLDVVVVITAKNNTTGSMTSGSTTTATMGPAKLNLSALDKTKNSLSLSWNDEIDANGYVIYRQLNSKTNPAALDNKIVTDSYYFDKATNELNCLTGDTDNTRAQIELTDGVYTFKDIYQEPADSDSSYQMNQSMIPFGLPFGYFVMPVYSADDVKFSNLEINIKNSFKMKYKPVNTATIGYGMNIECGKAESDTIQSISWDIPYGSENIPANLYRRTAGNNSNQWKLIRTTIGYNSKNTTYVPQNDDKFEAFEYIVAYGETAEYIEIPASLIKVLLDDANIDSRYSHIEGFNERKNKGYLLTLDFNASYGGNRVSATEFAKDSHFYSEMVTWNTWDYTKRQIGPSGGTIYIFNKNNSDGWVEICNIDKNCKLSDDTFDLVNTTVEKNSDNKIFLSPKNFAGDIIDGTELAKTEGPLQILRDAYHYYKLDLFADIKNEKGETETIKFAFGENIDSADAVKAYRQINDAELVKCANLIFADVFKGNKDSRKIENSSNDYVNFWKEVKEQSITNWIGTDYLIWTFCNYTHSWDELPSEGAEPINSFLKIHDMEKYGGIYWNAQKGTKIQCIAKESREVSKSNVVTLNLFSSEIPLESYKATYEFSCDNQYGYFYIYHNNVKTFEKEINGNNELIKQWIPLEINGNNSFEGKNTVYGWWN